MAGRFVLLSGEQPVGTGADVPDIFAGNGYSDGVSVNGISGMGGSVAVYCAILRDHVPDGLRAILGASGVSPDSLAVEVSRGASLGAEHGLDGGSADAFSGNSGAALHHRDSDVCAGGQSGGPEHLYFCGLSLFDVRACQSELA